MSVEFEKPSNCVQWLNFQWGNWGTWGKGLAPYSQLINNRAWNAGHWAQSGGGGGVCVCVCVCVFVSVNSWSWLFLLYHALASISLLSPYLSHSYLLICHYLNFSSYCPPPPTHTHTWTVLIASYLVPASVSVPFLTVSPPALPPLTLEDRAHCPPRGIQGSPQSAFCIPSHSDCPLLWPNQITHWSPDSLHKSHLHSLAHPISYVENTL